MPRRCVIDPRLPGLLRAQDYVISRVQSLAMGMTRGSLDNLFGKGEWQILLPKTYLASPGEPSRRQLLIAAQLFGGPASAIDGPEACRFHGIKAVAVDENKVHVVEPWGSTARSTGFVVVRRSIAPIKTVQTARLRYVDPAAAVIAATRLMARDRSVLAALSDALQRGLVTTDDLLRAHLQGGPRNAKLTEIALSTLAAGVRSVPEADVRVLLSSSTILPTVEYNVWLQLANGRIFCVDALIEDSAVILETNGRTAHRREDLFEDMQIRHDELTVSGFCVLHNPPRRIWTEGRLVLRQVETCHTMYAGRGLPPGVRRLSDQEVADLMLTRRGRN